MRVSVITVCRNAEKVIQDCLASVSRQSHREIEHVIVDGCSSDDTLAIVYAHQVKSKSPMIIISEPDSGLYDAMNKGIARSSGEVICFLNADDFYLHDLSVQWAVKCAQVLPNPFLCCQTLVLNESTGSALLTRHRNVNRYYLYKNGFSHPSTFYRRETFWKCGDFSTNLPIAADYEWFLRAILKHGEIPALCPVATTVFRVGGISNSKANRHSREMEFREVRSKYFSANERRIYSNKLVDFFLDYEWLRLALAGIKFPGLRLIGTDAFHDWEALVGTT